MEIRDVISNAIVNAIHHGHIRKVRRIIDRYPNALQHIGRFNSPLDEAIMYKQLEIAQFLWEKGGRPNPEMYCNGVDGPMYWVMAFGGECTTMLKWLFENNVLPDNILQVKCNIKKRTLLDWAIARGQLDTARLFWERGGKPNIDDIYCDGHWTPVHRAASRGHISTLKWAIQENVLPRSALQIRDQHLCTPLDEAIAHGHLETAQFLWEHCEKKRYYVKKLCCTKYSARGIVKNGYTEILKWIFDENVVPLSTDDIRNLLDTAIGYGKLEIAQFLWREKGVKPEECISVHCAAFSGYTSVLKWLFENNIFSINVLKKKISGKTPLDYAIVQSRWETAALLRRLPVDPVFLAMQRAKRDHSSCVLRRLPNELLDMVVDEMAARFHLKVVW